MSAVDQLSCGLILASLIIVSGFMLHDFMQWVISLIRNETE